MPEERRAPPGDAIEPTPTPLPFVPPRRPPDPGSPPVAAAHDGFAARDLAGLRRVLSRLALGAGFGPQRAAEWVLAVDELLANAIHHGGGSGSLRAWADDDCLIAEVDDALPSPVVRLEARLPAPSEVGGRGIWLVQRFADRIEVGRRDGCLQVRVTFRPDPAEVGLTAPEARTATPRPGRSRSPTSRPPT